MTTPKLVILGAGYAGQELAKLATDGDYQVVGTARGDAHLEGLRALGAEAIAWSLGEPDDAWRSHLGPDTDVVYSIPTLFKNYDDSGGVPRHVEPVADVLRTCQAEGCRRFVYLSSTSVYGDHGGQWVDESSECRPGSPYGKMRVDIERYLLAAQTEFPVTIARLVGIYGPGRTLVNLIKAGRYTLVDGGKKVTNRIHVHDIARAVLIILDRAPKESRVYNITDGHPQAARDVIEFLCEQFALERPPEETLEEYADRVGDPNRVVRRTNSVRVLNERLRQELDFDLVYPDVYSGYSAVLEGEE